jgi:glutaredoxin-related protein
MKGTPEQPQCGFSRAVCQILDVQVCSPFLFNRSELKSQGVPRETIKSFNCLADQELREGIKEYRLVISTPTWTLLISVTGQPSHSSTSRESLSVDAISFSLVSYTIEQSRWT